MREMATTASLHFPIVIHSSLIFPYFSIDTRFVVLCLPCRGDEETSTLTTYDFECTTSQRSVAATTCKVVHFSEGKLGTA